MRWIRVGGSGRVQDNRCSCWSRREQWLIGKRDQNGAELAGGEIQAGYIASTTSQLGGWDHKIERPGVSVFGCLRREKGPRL